MPPWKTIISSAPLLTFKSSCLGMISLLSCVIPLRFSSFSVKTQTILSTLHAIGTWVKVQWSACVWTCVWALGYVSLVCKSAFVSAPCCLHSFGIVTGDLLCPCCFRFLWSSMSHTILCAMFVCLKKTYLFHWVECFLSVHELLSLLNPLSLFGWCPKAQSPHQCQGAFDCLHLEF